MPMAPGTLSYRYRPLLHFLQTLPAHQDQVRLTLADLHALLGPPSGGGFGAVPAWNAVDLTRVFRHRRDFHATLDRRDHAITFTRRIPEPLRRRLRQEA